MKKDLRADRLAKLRDALGVEGIDHNDAQLNELDRQIDEMASILFELYCQCKEIRREESKSA
jgi:hypothetical protein